MSSNTAQQAIAYLPSFRPTVKCVRQRRSILREFGQGAFPPIPLLDASPSRGDLLHLPTAVAKR
jgi:hypothetical protein